MVYNYSMLSQIKIVDWLVNMMDGVDNERAMERQTMNDVKITETVKAHQTVTATDANFKQQVLEAKGPVLVDFWAAWCGPCRMIGPVVEELAGEYKGRATVAKLDVDANGETAARYGITGIPTLLVFKNGQVVDKIVGVVPKKVLAAKLDAHLN
jgi:thioredoxin 1